LKVQDSPEWLKAKLKSVGFRPINNIVDIANFVMLECGQPLHAFDADEIHDKKIVVKCLPEGSLFRTLDDKEIKLHQNDLMICDSEGGMCIAGVYGGLHSGVKDTTTNIFLESACFHPKYIRRTSTAHGLRTDAAMHFEKGTDPANTIYALKRAANLIMEICGGKASSGIVDIYPEPVKEKIISLTWEKLNRITGINIPRQTALEILRALSFKLISTTEEVITVSAPSFKTDVTLSEDVIEEILRIYGYDHIEIPAAVRSSLTLGWENKKELLYEELSQLLAANGFREMMNNSISNSNYHETFFSESSDSIVRLLSYSNAGLDSLRTSLLFPALEVVRYNLNRKQSNLKLFEFGKGYRKINGGYQESSHLILIVSGHLTEESWKEKPAEADIYYVKGIIANVLKKAGHW
jgi:phenylalanyl-tRNA synthetase beta chain